MECQRRVDGKEYEWCYGGWDRRFQSWNKKLFSSLWVRQMRCMIVSRKTEKVKVESRVYPGTRSCLYQEVHNSALLGSVITGHYPAEIQCFTRQPRSFDMFCGACTGQDFHQQHPSQWSCGHPQLLWFGGLVTRPASVCV